MQTILQVDDDPNDVFFLQHAMRKVGMDNPVQVVPDGRQAIEYLKGEGKFADRNQFPLPCLVLLDLKLPYVMGLDVLEWIRLELPTSLVVIILTASAEDTDIATAYRLGANAFLTKPAEASKLEEIVKAIRDFWVTHNMLPQAPSLKTSLASAPLPVGPGAASFAAYSRPRGATGPPASRRASSKRRPPRTISAPAVAVAKNGVEV